MDLFELAASQHGVVRSDQALDLGITRARFRTLQRNGVLVRCLPEVFRLRGMPETWEQRLSAATLWLPGSMASHRAAGSLWSLRGFESAPVELLVERWDRRQRPPGVLVHETKDLVAGDVSTRGRIPCTSLVRTLVDLPAVVHEFKAGVALDQAMRRDPTVLARVGARHREVARRGRNGTTKLRGLLAERGVGDHKVDSGFERLALRLIADAGLPVPVTQFQVRDGELVCYLDVAWPDRLVAMECDSLEHHLSEAAFRWERKRRRLLSGLDWTVLEFTYREVTQEPDMVARELRRHLR